MWHDERMVLWGGHGLGGGGGWFVVALRFHLGLFEPFLRDPRPDLRPGVESARVVSLLSLLNFSFLVLSRQDLSSSSLLLLHVFPLVVELGSDIPLDILELVSRGLY